MQEIERGVATGGGGGSRKGDSRDARYRLGMTVMMLLANCDGGRWKFMVPLDRDPAQTPSWKSLKYPNLREYDSMFNF